MLNVVDWVSEILGPIMDLPDEREVLIQEAQECLRHDCVIPLDLAAKLNDVGVSIADVHLEGTY